MTDPARPAPDTTTSDAATPDTPPDRTDGTPTGATSAADLTVRPMRPDEAEPLRAIAARAFDAFDRLLYSTRGRDVLVAVDRDDRLVGGVILHATPAADRPAPNGRLGIVHFIFADPDAAIPGVGTVLRDAADARFAELGCTETSARIDAVNTASQALHRSGGYRLATAGDQLRRWGWRLPLRWWQAGHGFDPGMQLWLRPGADTDAPPRPPWVRFAGTWALNVALLALVAWRAPRSDAGTLATLVTVAVAAAVLLGVREAALRAVTRRQRLHLQHAPWVNGVGLAGALALAVGVWLPLTGSATPSASRWRHDRVVRPLGRAHLAGGLAVAALAWVAVLVDPGDALPAWGEVQRAAVMVALLDLVVPVSPMIGTAARHVREWSLPAWSLLAVAGLGPLVVTLV